MMISYLPSPKLSPTNNTNKLLEWHIKEGDLVEPYTLACTVEAHGLTQTSDAASIMDVEIVDELIVKKLLVNVGDTIDVNLPMALLIEEDEDDNDNSSVVDLTRELPIESHAAWQAYVKSKDDEGSCGSC